MRNIFALSLYGIAACNLNIDIDVDTMRIDSLSAVPAQAAPVLELPLQAIVFNIEQAKDTQRRFGPDRIAAIRGVRLELISAQYEGIDLERIAAPTITIGTQRLSPEERSLELDGDAVDMLRVKLLLGMALELPLTLTFEVPSNASSAVAPTIHVVLVFQPTLHVDWGRSW